MDKKKFERMAEIMKGCCKDEESMVNYCAMMKKMMQWGQGKVTEEKKKETGEAE